MYISVCRRGGHRPLTHSPYVLRLSNVRNLLCLEEVCDCDFPYWHSEGYCFPLLRTNGYIFHGHVSTEMYLRDCRRAFIYQNSVHKIWAGNTPTASQCGNLAFDETSLMVVRRIIVHVAVCVPLMISDFDWWRNPVSPRFNAASEVGISTCGNGTLSISQRFIRGEEKTPYTAILVDHLRCTGRACKCVQKLHEPWQLAYCYVVTFLVSLHILWTQSVTPNLYRT